MKKAISTVLVFIFLLSLFACDQESTREDDLGNLSVQSEHLFTLAAPENLFVAVQGATFDGEYYYIAFVNKYFQNETAIIVKADKYGNEVQRSEILPLDHANSITILKNGNLMVAHCQSPDGHYYRYSILDKDTLKIIETNDLNEPFMAIAYCQEKQCFVGGEWNGDKMNVYGRDLQLLYSFNVSYKSESVPQSYFCTDDAIYALRFINKGYFCNYLYVFSYDGKTLLEYELDLPSLTEAESVSVIGKDVYIICDDYDNCTVYRITNLIK